MEPCLIIFDIDETLYINHESRIPESTLDAIGKLKATGHTLAIATGRSPFELMDEAKQLPVDFFILANGQLVLKNEEVIYENPIKMDVINEMIADAEAKNVCIGFSSATHSSVTGMTDAIRDMFAKYYSNLPEISKGIDSHGSIYQIWYLSEDLAAITEKYKGKLRFIPWLNHGADVIPVGVSKAVGLTKTLEALKSDLPEKIVFFGDGINDIELIEMADIGVAMGNAVEPLKRVADFVTKNIEDDGIYYACQQLGLFHNKDSIQALITQLEERLATVPSLDHYFQLKSLYSSYMSMSKKALEVLEDARVHFPENVKLLIELATVCEFELEDNAKARLYYEMVLALDPTHELALDALDVLNDKSIHPN